LILDTTYLLPLAQIAVDTDLLAAVAKKNTDLKLENIVVSLISIFELQAKAAKLKVPAKSTIRAVDAILSAFRVIPFYEAGVIETAQRIRKIIPDYVDCIILATAVVSKEDLVTEDSIVSDKREKLLKDHQLKVLNFSDLMSA
jgi:PIN domain nuclease of toxin-antitoxin system